MQEGAPASVVETATYAAQALFLFVALYVAWTTLRSPRRSNLFALTFFVLLAMIIAFTWVQAILNFAPDPVEMMFPAILILFLPYILLRLAGEYSSVSTIARRLSEFGLAAAIIASIFPGVDSPLALFLLLAYFVTVASYAARRFALAAQHANGITRMRLRSLSTASILMGVALFSVMISSLIGGIVSELVSVARQLLLMGSALLYFAGFSPPVLLRRAWQEPELRRFLHETRQVPSGMEFDEALRQIERVTAETLGAPYATIGLWNQETGLIDYPLISLEPGETIGGRAFVENRPILSLDTVRDDPDNRELYELGEAYAVMAAPIQTDEGTIGVIALYAPNPPLFAEDDLGLLALLADQIGILLENVRHVQAQAELAALQASTRLKDEFLSVAAHDLKTPLTTILATGQYLERRLADLDPDSSEVRSIARLNREAVRLRKLVAGLLDASRIERGYLILDVDRVDLSAMLNEVVDRVSGHQTHHIEASIAPGVFAQCDGLRIQQVAENILENAQKYSPTGSTIAVRLRQAGESVVLEVSDQGIGIAPDDHTRIFDRYYRSNSTDSHTVQGIGLGLYICNAIVEQHNGSTTVESSPGEGSTFRVSIPAEHGGSGDSSASPELANGDVLQQHERAYRPRTPRRASSQDNRSLSREGNEDLADV